LGILEKSLKKKNSKNQRKRERERKRFWKVLESEVFSSHA
jgi:hypothetical protein